MIIQKFIKKCEEFVLCGGYGDADGIFTDGYPDNPVKGNPIDVSDIKDKDLLFHASVELKDEKFIQMGSRAVAVVGHGESIWEADQIAEKNISKVEGPLFHRKDIGTTELIQQKINHMVSIK